MNIGDSALRSMRYDVIQLTKQFKEFKALVENHTERRSRPYVQIMAENHLGIIQ